MWKRLSGVVVGGVGEVFPQLGDISADDVLFNGGFGLRYRLTKENPLNYRIDFAWGRDGFEVYFSISEAF